MSRGSVQPVGTARAYPWLSAIGVLAAAVIVVCGNVLVARFYVRWDVTSRGLYTLSRATTETLEGLDRKIDVVVFLSRSDPLTLSVRHMLSAYSASTRYLSPRFVDPDQEPAEFLALQQKYDILTGRTEDGRLVTDASIVVATEDRHWFITSDELVQMDADDGRVRPRLEQALTSAIRNVLQNQKAVVCFSAGHQEFNVDSGGPTGLAELRFRLEKNNYLVRPAELGRTARLPSLDECRVLIVAGPEQTFSTQAARHVAEYFRAGGNLLLLVDPVPSEDDRIQPSGLESVAAIAGVTFGADLVIERDPELRLAGGVGEAFFATPREHDVTRGLVQGEQIMFRPVLNLAQSLGTTPNGSPVRLIETSEQAFSVRDLRALRREGVPPEPDDAVERGRLALAMAAELPPADKKAGTTGPRAVIVGSSNVAWSRNWADPAMLGNRLFVESAVSWLAARPPLVSVPEKESAEPGLVLTDDALGEVFRYVLFYMPGSAAAFGLFVLWRRRTTERRARRASRDPKPKSGPKPRAPDPPASAENGGDDTSKQEVP